MSRWGFREKALHGVHYPTWKVLTYAIKDAQGVAEFLKGQGFQVTTLYNQQATRNAIMYQMQNVLAPRVKERDRVLVFFAGHGYTERFAGNDYGYIIPYDADEYSHTFISMEELQTLSRKMGQAKHQLFIMDACYGGLLGVRSGAISESVPNYLDEITKRRARQILTAGGPNQQVVDGGPGEHSVFTGYLLKGLQEGEADLNGDGYVTFAELTSYLVPAATNTYQTPGYSALPGHELGEFIFRSPKRATPARTQPAPPTDIKPRGPDRDIPRPIEEVRPPPSSPSSPAGSAIVGKVKYAGIPPRPEQLPVTKDQAVCGTEAKVSQALLVGPDKGLQNVVVFLPDIQGGKAQEKSARNPVLDQKQCEYHPHIQILPMGSILGVLNSDDVLHNVQSPNAPTRFNLAQPRFKRKIEIPMEGAGIISVRCNVHPWMTAILVVSPNPYYTLTDKHGAFKLTDVPPGKYLLKLWHETLGEQRQEVTVHPNEELKVAFEFKGK